jgi:hypothetical protein
MSLVQWAIPRLSPLLPLEEADLKEVIKYTNTLSDEAAADHLHQLLGDSQPATDFTTQFISERKELATGMSKDVKSSTFAPPPGPPPGDHKHANGASGASGIDRPAPLPPAYTPSSSSSHQADISPASVKAAQRHTNAVIEAARIRAKDEQQMQQALQNLQYQYGIYNSDIEPEHDTDNYCFCPIHQYQRMKRSRYGVQDRWSKAVLYPGEKAYNDGWTTTGATGLFSSNPYANRVVSPFGYSYARSWSMGPQRPVPNYHARAIHQTIDLNNHFNQQAQANIAAQEPKHSIWDDDALDKAMSGLAVGGPRSEKAQLEKGGPSSINGSAGEKPKMSRMASIRKSIGIKSSDERAIGKVEKSVGKGKALRDEILAEERGRWPDDQWRQIVNMYQDKVGMIRIIADLRARSPIQYLHMLRAGYFEPIPVAWADQASNPLKFSIEAAAGWRGITPAWRGYEDTAEERLYWVLNHREGSVGMRMKPGKLTRQDGPKEIKS